MVEQTIWVQNFSKMTVLHVRDPPPFTEIFPLKLKLMPDESKHFKVSFMCRSEENIDTEVYFKLYKLSLYPRGTNPIKIPFKV